MWIGMPSPCGQDDLYELLISGILSLHVYSGWSSDAGTAWPTYQLCVGYEQDKKRCGKTMVAGLRRCAQAQPTMKRSEVNKPSHLLLHERLASF